MKKSVKEKLEGLFFKVEKMNIRDYFPKAFNFAPQHEYVIIAHTPDGPLVVNSCSADYALVSNESMLTPLISLLDKEYTVDIKIQQSGFSKFYIDFILRDEKFNLGSKAVVDEISARVRINNSYDGSMRYSHQGGFFRTVCSNGAAVPVEGKSSQKFSSMHTPGMEGGSAAEKTMEFVRDFAANAGELIKGFKPLLDHKMSKDAAIERMDQIIKVTDYPARSLDVAKAQLDKEHLMGFKITDYLVYNALNFGLHQNENSKLKTHKADKIDQEVLQFMLKTAS